jgi:hypothetical protein
MKISHEVLLAVSLLTVFLSNDIVATEMEPLLRIFRIRGKIIRKEVSLIRKLYVFCLTYVYTHKIETSVAGVLLFTLAEIFYDSTRELVEVEPLGAANKKRKKPPTKHPTPGVGHIISDSFRSIR